MIETFYSQIGQDKYYITDWLPRVGIDPAKHQGRFLDVGAHDGRTESNTLALEARYKWNGVLIEANPVLAAEAAEFRYRSEVVPAVVWSSVCDLDFEYPGRSGTGDDRLPRIANLPWNGEYFKDEFFHRRTYSVRTRTLAEILGPGRHYFDYGSIDIEGAELEALRGIDWETTSFGYLAIEWGERRDYLNELIALLGRAGYRVHRVNQFDVDFVPERIEQARPVC